ncbi:ABC transporter permease [Mucilaginibacter sp. SMC90]|uniref:ABC transporter permease n=1 Tax=Mucilaginibacter sp. SMC90 TaxID=2929803 RepID=UPI001FB2A0BF|nr:ABC transporter permease [Mucilaginibacter sp. SMC90]UOE50868.1 ABC transporter permease [Mucilaginibacter sp. SMC90]
MLKHYLKMTFRDIWRNKKFSAINILGLAIGMAAFILIFLWLLNMLTFDRFHKNADQIMVICSRDKYIDGVYAWRKTPKILGGTLKHDYRQVEEMTRFANNQYLLTFGDKKLTANGSFVDPGFLQMFDFPLLKGDPKQALSQKDRIVITEKFAKSLFGDEDAMGKVIKVDTSTYVTVSGVMKDLPANTMFDFNYLLSWEYLKKDRLADENWSNSSVYTFVQLRNGYSNIDFDREIENISADHTKDSANPLTVRLFTQPLKRFYLYSDSQNGQFTTGRIVLVQLFAIVAIFILVIAAINFMNLSTARSEKRAREVGLKKAIGTSRYILIIQFLVESLLMSFIAFFVAISITLVVLPFYSDLVHVQLSIPFNSSYFWIAVVVFILLTGLLAGSYPAFYLSSFKPIAVLSGSFKPPRSRLSLRSVLVVLQFTFTTVLIISTIIVEREINYAQGRSAGYDQNSLVFTHFTGKTEKNYQLIKDQLLNTGAVLSVTKSLSPVTESSGNIWGVSWPGSSRIDLKTIFARYSTDADFVKTMKVRLLEGRDIDSYSFPLDSSAILLNESAKKAIGIKNVIGLKVNEGGRDWHVVGVISDFVIGSPYEKIAPMIIEGPFSSFNAIHYRLNPVRSVAENLDKIGSVFKKLNPDFPFEYQFADESFNLKFRGMQGMEKLAFVFAGLSIFISCLGLLGLITFVGEVRLKEISIHKVLGATTVKVFYLLTFDLFKLILVSFIFAIPFALYIKHIILQKFTYSIGFSFWWFLFAVVLSLLLALLTICYQTLKTARTNPVKALKAE